MATEEQQAAALIRDHVVPLVKARGQAQPVGPTSETMWEAGPFRFMLRTASSPASLIAGAPAYSEAQAEKVASEMLPNGLDIWHNERVLSVEWDAGQLRVINIQRGPWEDAVLALR
jgi:hypothetical protein